MNVDGKWGEKGREGGEEEEVDVKREERNDWVK